MTEMDKQQQELIQKIEDRIKELKEVKVLLLNSQKDLDCIKTELDLVRKQNDRLMDSLKNCANELCMKCGKYRNDHLGACDSCKWRDVKFWETD